MTKPVPDTLRGPRRFARARWGDWGVSPSGHATPRAAIGFPLRVSDVERQPFRSMGFVSVIIASALFALGLPLVLL